jgi:hypothetical protein
MSQVHDRYLLIKNKSTGVDPLVDQILSGTEEDKPTFLLYQKARQIHFSKVKQVYVESCLLASKDLEKISEIIEIPVDVLSIYRQVFFDVATLDKLSLLELVEGTDDSKERSMKLWAISQGLDFIKWRLGSAVIVNPVDGLQELFTLSVYKSKEALFSSDSLGEANKWAKLSMELARILKTWVMDNNAARKDIELALQSVIPDFKGFDDLD